MCCEISLWFAKIQQPHLSRGLNNMTITTLRRMLVCENPSRHRLASAQNITTPTNKQANKQTRKAKPWTSQRVGFFLHLSGATPGAGLRRSSLKGLQPMTALFTAGSCTPLISKMCSRSASVTYKLVADFKGPWHSTKLCYSHTLCQFNTKVTTSRLGAQSSGSSCRSSGWWKSKNSVLLLSGQRSLDWGLIQLINQLIWGTRWFLPWLNKVLECDWWPYKYQLIEHKHCGIFPHFKEYFNIDGDKREYFSFTCKSKRSHTRRCVCSSTATQPLHSCNTMQPSCALYVDMNMYVAQPTSQHWKLEVTGQYAISNTVWGITTVPLFPPGLPHGSYSFQSSRSADTLAENIQPHVACSSAITPHHHISVTDVTLIPRRYQPIETQQHVQWRHVTLRESKKTMP